MGINPNTSTERKAKKFRSGAKGKSKIQWPSWQEPDDNLFDSFSSIRLSRRIGINNKDWILVIQFINLISFLTQEMK